VVINYGQGQEARVSINRGLMEPVGLLPNQAVTVTLFFPSSKAGAPVAISLYDGGQINPPGSLPVTVQVHAVPATGLVQFNFQADRTPGLYRVLLSVGGNDYLLRFYAVKPGTPPRGQVPRPPSLPTPFPSPTPP
jgi:hypothetical protein